MASWKGILTSNPKAKEKFRMRFFLSWLKVLRTETFVRILKTSLPVWRSGTGLFGREIFTGAGHLWVEEVPGTFSPVYWGRYVFWVFTTPSMLWDLVLAGAPTHEIDQVLIYLWLTSDALVLKSQTKISGSSSLVWLLSSIISLSSWSTPKPTR